MKYLATILSVYMLLLIAIPCIDEPTDGAMCQTELSQTNHNNQQHNMGHCSPLCTCQCCASPIVYSESDIQFTNNSFAQKLLSTYSSITPFACISLIWQPPKSERS